MSAVPAKKDKKDLPASPANVDQMHIRLGHITERCSEIQNTADAERRPMNAEELAELESLQSEFDGIENELKVRNAAAQQAVRLAALAEPNPRLTKPEGVENSDGDVPRQRITGGMPVGASKSTLGFRSMGDWFLAAQGMRNGRRDERIVNAASVFGSEGVNQDGGFAVPPEFRANIMKSVQAEESLLSRVDQQTTSGNSLTLPIDHETPWDNSNGVKAEWIGEGSAQTPTKPNFKGMEVRTHKLRALVALTDELMADAPSLSSWLMRKVPEKFTSEINNVLITGTGAGQPQGILSAPSKIAAAAVNGAENSVTAKNVSDMWARLYAPLRRNAVWLINQDVEPQLQLMSIPGTNPSFPAYLPPGGFSQAPYATLFGRPVIAIEACKALGTEGDIILFAPETYLALLKSDGPRSDVSIHLYFDQDVTAVRFVMRLGGQSYWPSSLARKNGSNTLSNIVTLESSRTA